MQFNGWMLRNLHIRYVFFDHKQGSSFLIVITGSTGTPKGVDVSHANVTNALLLEPANLGIKIGSKVGSVLSVAFDMGAWEILAGLMNGGTLYLRGSRWEATLREARLKRLA